MEAWDTIIVFSINGLNLENKSLFSLLTKTLT